MIFVKQSFFRIKSVKILTPLSQPWPPAMEHGLQQGNVDALVIGLDVGFENVGMIGQPRQQFPQGVESSPYPERHITLGYPPPGDVEFGQMPVKAEFDKAILPFRIKLNSLPL